MAIVTPHMMYYVTKYIFPKYLNNSNSIYMYNNVFKWNINTLMSL